MSAVDMLRVVVSERLTAAAEEIFGLFEKTIAQYEEELCRSKLENERQSKLLDAVLKPEVRLHRTVLPEDVQQDSQPTYFKEEPEQLWSSQGGERLLGPPKSEDDLETAQSSQLHQRQTEENREAEAAASSSAQHMDTECDGKDCAGSSRILDPHSRHLDNDDENPNSPEQTDSSDDDAKEPQSDLNTVKPKQTRTGVSVFQPASDDRTSDSSEPETENSYNWKETRPPQSNLKTLTKSGVPAGDKECNTRKKSLSCSECGKTFDTQNRVQSNRTSPSGDKPFVCSVCVQKPTQSAHLVTQTRSGKKSFGCSVCKRQFSFKGDAVRHIRIHTGERPFCCLVCGKSFTQSSGLGTHMRSHTGEKPFSCSLCNKRFIRSGILARHMRVHTGEKPYCCSVCNARFSLSQSLLKHMRIHTGEKPFSCSVCCKKFTQKGHLTQHMTLHTGEKSFSCHVCGRKFTRQSRVKNHKCVTESGSSQ